MNKQYPNKYRKAQGPERRINPTKLNTLFEGDELIGIVVRNIGEKGHGIAKYKENSTTSGITIIILNNDLKIGQEVDIRITRVKNTFAFARLL